MLTHRHRRPHHLLKRLQVDNIHRWITSEFANNTIPPAFQQWFTTQDTWTRAQIAANPTDNYWQGLGAIMSQFDGMLAGYNAQAPPNMQLTVWDFQQLNGLGDFLDLMPAIGDYGAYSRNWNWDTMTDDELVDRVRKTTHCSALVKVNGDFTDMWFGHAAWFTFEGIIRIFKSYNTPLHNPAAVGKQFSFASYPGYLESLDDYWLVYDSGMWLSETTNSIFNTSLYKTLQPNSLWSWQRIRLVALLANSGAQAVEIMDTHSSYTYNNQWIFLDLKLFKPGQALQPGLLWIYESVPSFGIGQDVTDTLARGYWPSYNVPYIRQIYDISGYDEQLQKRVAANNGTMSAALAGLDYQMAPRAKIFRRQQGSVDDTNSFLSLMRYNDYKNDPYAGGDPWNAICSRGDLSSNPSPDGCYDLKASQWSWFAAKQSTAISGPTTGDIPPGGSLPPFSWSEFPNAPHEGLPQTFNFAFEDMTPEWA